MSERKHEALASEEWSTALPGLDLCHDMQFGMKSFDAVAGLAERFGHAGASVQALSVQAQNDTLAVRCRIRGVSPRAARDLVDALARAGAIEAPISVEHLMLARKG